MKVIYKKLPSKKKDCVATIGVFDGIHLGHQFILKKVRQEALNTRACSLVITFDIPPQKIFDKNIPASKNILLGCLTDSTDKKDIIKLLGIDYLWFLKIRPSFIKLSAREFIDYLSRHFTIKKLIVGEDFRFGHKGEGNVAFLKKLSKEYHFNLSVLKKINKEKEIVSSSLIRRLVKEGNLRKAKILLGRSYYLKGKVIKGLGYGSRIGFPTANIHLFGYIIPSMGVYAAFSEIGEKKYLSAVNIGIRPTVAKSKREVLEVHIINFHKNIFGKKIKITFLEKIRDEKKFATTWDLKDAIRSDVNYITKHYRLS